MSSIGYHTRNGSTKIVGGSISGSFDMETVNRLVKHRFTVRVRNSGSLVFVDKEGREVSLYITVDPSSTEAGKIAASAARAERERRTAEEETKRHRIEQLLEGMSYDEALRRLTAMENSHEENHPAPSPKHGANP